MSIDNSPPGREIHPGPFTCPACYPGGDNPHKVYMCFQGIQKGALWAPGDPEPPNGVWTLQMTANCQWQVSAGGFDFTWMMVGIATLFLSKIPAGANAFLFLEPSLCAVWSANSIAVPAGNKYYSGWCTAFPVLEGVPFAIPDLMVLLSDDLFWAQWIMPRPMTADHVVYGLYDDRGATNLKIKLDHS